MVGVIEQTDAPYPTALQLYPRIRQSTLAQFDSCGLSVKFMEELEGHWHTHPQARGSMFHRLAGECFRVMQSTGEGRIEPEVALGILYDLLRQADVDRECSRCGSQNVADGSEGGKLTCGDCGHRFPMDAMNLPMREVADLVWVTAKWARDNEFDIGNLIDVEHRLEAVVTYHSEDGVPINRIITGRLDVVLTDPLDSRHAIVIDWKDTWALPPETEVSFDGYFQQRCYALLLFANYPSLRKVTLREFYVRRSQVREVTIERDHLEDVRGQFSALVERFDKTVEKKRYTPTPGKWCSFCPSPANCTILPRARDVGRITSEAEARKLAGQLIVAQAVVGKTRKMLRAWSAEHGPILVEDAKGRRLLGHHEAKVNERPSRDAMERALASGEPVDLDALYGTRHGTRFEQYVPGNGASPVEDAMLPPRRTRSAEAKPADAGAVAATMDRILAGMKAQKEGDG